MGIAALGLFLQQEVENELQLSYLMVPEVSYRSTCRTDLDFYYMDGVPAALDLLRVSSLLDEDYSCKAMVQIPQVHRAHTTLEVAVEG